MDAGRFDAGFDAGRTTCDDDLDCDDGFPCTDEVCVVGNVCEYTTFDSRCDAAAGERCLVGRGCVAGMPTDCEMDVDCQDGVFCNGDEQCVANGCYMGTAVSCNDGNSCTIDTCDEDIDGCTYDVAPGCDAGMMGFDAGMPCDPFETADYPGTFSFSPAASAACTGSAVFNISRMTITSSGGTLRISLDSAPFSLTQSPAPTDGTFDATYSDGCGNYRLQGMFTCADQWEGTWTATFSGSCSFCSSQNRSVRGSRR